MHAPLLTPIGMAVCWWILSALTPCAAAAPTAAPAAQADAADPAFDITEYRVLGNTTLEARDIETAVYSHLGLHKTFKDVELARAALEAAYHDRGYGTVFVDVPEQTVDDGVVRLRVTEGRLNAVTLTGGRFYSERQIRASLPAATAGEVPNVQELRSEISQVNAATPDRQVVPVLKAGPEPGTVDLAMKSDDRLPLHGSLELNNQYTVGTKPLRLLGSLSYGNMFQRLDTLSVQFQTAPQDTSNARVIAASYAMNVGSDRGQVILTYIDNKSAVDTVGTLGVLGTGQTYSIHFAQPLTTTTALSDSFFVGLDYKEATQNVLVKSGPGVNTPISYLNSSFGYGGFATESSRQWNWSSAINFGLRGKLNRAQEFDGKCFECRPNYFYVRIEGGMRQALPWGLALSLRAGAQGALEPLINNEQFYVGGAGSVRGYLVAEELGDDGANGTVELQFPNLLGRSTHAAQWRLIPAVFFDAGFARILQPLGGQDALVDLRSAGVGAEFGFYKWLSGSFYWADPLVSGANTRAYASRFEFAVRWVW